MLLFVILCEVCTCSSFFFFKQKTAYEMRISDWSSDVCSSDLPCLGVPGGFAVAHQNKPHQSILFPFIPNTASGAPRTATSIGSPGVTPGRSSAMAEMRIEPTVAVTILRPAIGPAHDKSAFSPRAPTCRTPPTCPIVTPTTHYTTTHHPSHT